MRLSSDAVATAYISGSIHRGESPISLVLHNEDGDWQFLDGDEVDVEDGFAVHVEHVFDERPELGSLADLPLGWAAERSAVDEMWKRFPWPEDAIE
jgi:hypothetical protein